MQAYYSKDHLWVSSEKDGSMIAGITNHAQNTLGDIVFVDFPAIGSQLKDGVACGVIESVKTASDLHAPMDGEVIGVNETLRDSPELINDAAEQTWIFRFQPADASQTDRLMSETEYQASLE